MTQFHLAEIITKDKLVHQGIFYNPKNPGSKALLWIHGLTGTFYGGVKMLEILTHACEKEGWGFASFNNRGHDMVSGAKKLDPINPKGYSYTMIGAGNEKFEECIHDIEAGVDFLVQQGFKEIILIGHSSGANKVCYYAGVKKHPQVMGIVLASPVSDRLVPRIDQVKIKRSTVVMNTLIKKAQGKELLIGHNFFPVTPYRFLSLYLPHSQEDVFDYGDEIPKMKLYSQIKKPLLVVFGNQDDSMDRPATQIQKVFDTKTTSLKYKSVIIPNAEHNFTGQEENFVKTIVEWVKTI